MYSIECYLRRQPFHSPEEPIVRNADFTAFWETENSSRARIDFFRGAIEPEVMSLYGILTSAFSNKNLISLCGIRAGQQSISLRASSLEDIDMLLVAFDVTRSATLRHLDLSENNFGILGKIILGESVRENAVLKTLSFGNTALYGCCGELDKLHQAKVHSFNYRMGLSLFLKNYDVNTAPIRLIFEYLFGYDYIETCNPNLFLRTK